MDSAQSYWTNRALLEWQVEMGATEAMLDTPVNRYELPDQVAKPAAKAAEHAASGVPDIPAAPKVDTVSEAMRMAHDAVVPWRPAQDRPPDDGDREMLLPFLHRHITLANPDVLVLMGSVACHALLGESGITRLRGRWAEVLGRPALPMFHPAHLLRTPAAKREAWADLLALRARLRG